MLAVSVLLIMRIKNGLTHDVLVLLPSSRMAKHVRFCSSGSVSSFTYLLVQPLPLIELQMLLSCVLEVPAALVMTYLF